MAFVFLIVIFFIGHIVRGRGGYLISISCPFFFIIFVIKAEMIVLVCEKVLEYNRIFSKGQAC